MLHVLHFHSADEGNRQVPIPNLDDDDLYGSTFLIGPETFMAAALQFCKNEAHNGTIDIISVGSGSGNIERRIIREYRRSFGKDLHIILVDPDMNFSADFKTVEDLIKQLPRLIGHCVLLIIWPLHSDAETDDGYDIDAVRRLQPNAVLALYETAGCSGSTNFCALLHNDDGLISPTSKLYWREEQYREIRRNLRISSTYSIVDIAQQKSPVGYYRLVKLIRSE